MGERHLINPQILGVPNAEQQARIDAGETLTNIWQGEMQQIPANMRNAPVSFANGLALGLPGVRRIRMAFNTYTFNPDGSMHPQMESFLGRAAELGFEILWVLMDGPSQESGNSDGLIADWPNSYSQMTTLADWRGLMPRLAARHAEAWSKLLNWLAMRPNIISYGFEAINEPASYGRAAGRFPADAAEFVHAYVAHVEAIFHRVSAAYPQADFYVGGWNYSATFDVLADTLMPSGVSALHYLRALAGPRLVWSVHLYPQWGPGVQTLGSLYSWLDRRLRPVLGERMVFTEFNSQNSQVNRWQLASDDNRSTFMFARAGEWFRKHGVGIGWWPAVNYASGYMFFVSASGNVRQRQQNTYGAALGLFAYDNHPDIFAGLPVSGHSPLTVVPLDEPPTVTANDWRNPATVPVATSFAYGFGGAGVCVLTGDAASNNFLYGGNGRNIIYGGPHDDHLMTGRGGGVIRTGPGNNVITVNGGEARVYCGPGYNLVSLYRGATELVLDPAGKHLIFGFSPIKGDRVSFRGAFPDLVALRQASSTPSAGSNISSEINLVVNLPEGGQAIFQNGAQMVDTLHRSTLDLTSGWFGIGWEDPVDYTIADFSAPVVPPTEPAAAASSWAPRLRDGAVIPVVWRTGEPAALTLRSG